MDTGPGVAIPSPGGVGQVQGEHLRTPLLGGLSGLSQPMLTPSTPVCQTIVTALYVCG